MNSKNRNILTSITARIRRILPLIFGVFLFGLILHLSNFDDINRLPPLNSYFLIASILIIGIAQSIFSIRWGLVVNGMSDHPISLFTCYVYALTSLATGLVISQTASLFVVRSVALQQKENMPIGRSIATVLIDKLFDLFIVLCYLLPSILLVLNVIDLDIFVLSILLILISVSLLMYWRYKIWITALQSLISFALTLFSRIKFVQRLLKAQLVSNLQKIEFLDILPHRTVIIVYLITLIGEVFLVLRSWLVAQAVGLDVHIVLLFAGVIITQSSIVLAITPGGIGILETVWYFTLLSSNSNTGSIALFLIVHRLVGTLANILLWLLSLIVVSIRSAVSIPRDNTHPPKEVDV